MASVSGKVLSIYVALAFVSIPFLGFATADGCIMAKRATQFYMEQDSQYAVINYVDGVQKMIISIDFEWRESEKTAWIFPIPSDPESIDIDVSDGAPVFEGQDVVEEAWEDLGKASLYFSVSYGFSVVAPWPFTALFGLYFMVVGLAPGHAGLDVHEHLEKYGLVVEVISAEDGASIYNYLTQNGLDVSEGVTPQLDDYLEKDYSFVVTWMEDAEVRARNPGLIVEFPTEDLFYPLMLTSVYEDRVIPMEIMVVGHVSPRVYSEIAPYTDVTYWDGNLAVDYSSGSSEFWDFVNEIKGNWDRLFTRIQIEAPSSSFTDDLWIEREAPAKVKNAMAIHRTFSSPIVLLEFLILFVVASLVLGVVVGGTVFGWKKKAVPYYILMGAGNLLGIFGLWLATKTMRDRLEYSPDKGLMFMGIFAAAFVCVILATFGVLALSIL